MMGTDAERCWVRCLDVASSMRDSAVNGGIELEVEVLDELKVVIEAGFGTHFLRKVLEVWMVAVRNAPVPSGFRPEGSIMGFVKDLEAVRKIVRIGATNIYQWQGKVGSHVDFARRFRLYAGSNISLRLPKDASDALSSALRSRLLSDETGIGLMSPDNWMTNEEIMRIGGALQELSLDNIAVDTATSVLHGLIDEVIRRRTASAFEEAVYLELQKWLHEIAPQFLDNLLWSQRDIERSEAEQRIREWTARMDYYMATQLASLYITHLFEIVVDYPNSFPVLEDLKQCLARTDAKRDMIERFKEEIKRRLLHAGAMTGDILSFYISAVKVFSFLDPRGPVLSEISVPIHHYLRGRPDIVRCIVEGITGRGGDLSEELRSHTKSLEDFVFDSDGELISNWEEDEEEDEETWQPEEYDVKSTEGSLIRGGDVLAALLGIFPSRDVFIEGYQEILAEKLLNDLDCDYEDELRNLEMLKARFGEGPLHGCTVMAKDIAASKRLQSSFQTPLDVGFPVDIVIATKTFWPKLGGKRDCAGPWNGIRQCVSDEYERLKAPRKLDWHLGSGAVELSLAFEDGRQVTAIVTPQQGMAITPFEEKPIWTVSELSECLDLSVDVLKKRLHYWVLRGILEEESESNSYRLVEYSHTTPSHPIQLPMEEDHDATNPISGLSKEAEQMKIYESYIMGMLSNFDGLSAEIIHNRLKIFVVAPPYDKTESELTTFLQKMVLEEKLECQGNQFSLRRG